MGQQQGTARDSRHLQWGALITPIATLAKARALITPIATLAEAIRGCFIGSRNTFLPVIIVFLLEIRQTPRFVVIIEGFCLVLLLVLLLLLHRGSNCIIAPSVG